MKPLGGEVLYVTEGKDLGTFSLAPFPVSLSATGVEPASHTCHYDCCYIFPAMIDIISPEL